MWRLWPELPQAVHLQDNQQLHSDEEGRNIEQLGANKYKESSQPNTREIYWTFEFGGFTD